MLLKKRIQNWEHSLGRGPGQWGPRDPGRAERTEEATEGGRGWAGGRLGCGPTGKELAKAASAWRAS